MSEIYIGIDNGISGAIAVLRGKQLDAWHRMPVQKTRKGNEIDALNVWAILKPYLEGKVPVTVLIEEPGGSKSAKAAASMAGSFHCLRTIMALNGVRWHRITPQSWQKPMLKCKKGDTKPAALALARQLWPAETWLASKACRTPDNGGIDAALIAEHGRRNQL